jgi:hypothetical protein
MAHPHWSLFEVIDEDLHSFSRQVEFAQANFPTYSVTLLRLYLSICSEIDVIGKLLCQRIGATLPNKPNMDDYRQNLHSKYPHLWELKIKIRPMAFAIWPWDRWSQNQNPDWWQKHQKVKHQRDLFFPDANLENVLHAAAGLLLFLTYWHQPELWKLEVSPDFHVFQIEGVRDQSIGYLTSSLRISGNDHSNLTPKAGKPPGETGQTQYQPSEATKLTKPEIRRRSAAVTRQFALLRAHGLLRKMPRSHRYQLTSKGRRIITALLAACYADVEQLTKIAA